MLPWRYLHLFLAVWNIEPFVLSLLVPVEEPTIVATYEACLADELPRCQALDCASVLSMASLIFGICPGFEADCLTVCRTRCSFRLLVGFQVLRSVYLFPPQTICNTIFNKKDLKAILMFIHSKQKWKLTILLCFMSVTIQFKIHPIYAQQLCIFRLYVLLN